MSFRRVAVRSARAILLIALGAGCAVDAVDTAHEKVASTAADEVPVQAITSDLRLGDDGPAVSALHSYLTRFGYFPNAAIANAYPRWQPLVAEAPAYPDVFDDQTRAAVYAYQQQNALEMTGFVDAATRAMLQQPR